MSKRTTAKTRPIPPTVDIPADFQKALASKPAMQKKFESMPPSHRRKYEKWIIEAKKNDTRPQTHQARPFDDIGKNRPKMFLGPSDALAIRNKARIFPDWIGDEGRNTDPSGFGLRSSRANMTEGRVCL